MISGFNPANLCGWADKDENLTFAQVASVSGQFAQHWTLRILAQEAAPKELANGRLRRLLAPYRPFTFTDVRIGDTALFSTGSEQDVRPAAEGSGLDIGHRRGGRDGEAPVTNMQGGASFRTKERG